MHNWNGDLSFKDLDVLHRFVEKLFKNPPLKEDEEAFGLFSSFIKNQCNDFYRELEKYDLEIDHIVPKSKGGGNYYENYQLLCGNYNKIKGNRPMEYLRTKIKAREDIMKTQITFGE